ncbi:glycosyltransferase family 2 protein [Niabella insulamsoli]|uniref:glycosyltransferase family 2 protein n=1 Tax=Niabella insulamsoli TaxID=3144874 RepID=UPI0031FC82E7
MNISLLVGLKNNIAYTKHFYATTRALYPDIELVFVSYGSTDDTHSWLDSLSDENLQYHYSTENKTLSDTYNKCIDLATKEFVAFLHNDMVLGNGFAENLVKEAAADKVLFYKVVEPPIFSDDPHDWKIVKDFGADLDSFQLGAFRHFSSSTEKTDSTPTTDPTFFLLTSRSTLVKINGLDPLFDPMFCEDNDILYRLGMWGLNFYQSHSAIAYHFVSKTSRFSNDYIHKTKKIETRSNRNFCRKWGFQINAVSKQKRQYGLNLKNANKAALKQLEPFVSRIFTTFDPTDYIAEEQPYTRFDLLKKFTDQELTGDDILIYFNTADLNEDNLKKFENLADELDKRLHSKWFRLKKRFFFGNRLTIGDLRIKINHLKTYQHELIVRN